jgi:hypothetical protein
MFLLDNEQVAFDTSDTLPVSFAPLATFSFATEAREVRD